MEYKSIKYKCSTDINLGIVEANKWKDAMGEYWWWQHYGFSYYSNGMIYRQSGSQKYGDKIKVNDIIHIHLDLKDDYDISWRQNDTNYGKGFDVQKQTEYRLAIGFYEGKIELLSFDATD